MKVATQKNMRKTAEVCLLVVFCCAQTGAMAQNRTPIKIRDYGTAGTVNYGGASQTDSQASSGPTVEISGMRLVDLERGNPFLKGNNDDLKKTVTLDGQEYSIKEVQLQGGYVEKYILEPTGSTSSTAGSSANTVGSAAKSLTRTPETATAVTTTPPATRSTDSGFSGGVSSYGTTSRTPVFDRVSGNKKNEPEEVVAMVPAVTQVETPLPVVQDPAPATTVTEPVAATTEQQMRYAAPSNPIARVGFGILRAVADGLNSVTTPTPMYTSAPQTQTVVVTQPTATAPATTRSVTTTQTAPVASNVINTPIRDKWAVIVGISKFQDPSIPQLKYPAKDAKDFYDYLVTKGNFKADHTRLLLNQDATRERIMTEIGDFLPRVVKKDDLVVFYFSSHGSPANIDVGNKNFLIAHDTKQSKLFAGGIDVQFIMELMGSRIKANRVLIVLDACHSAGAVGAKDTTSYANFNTDNFKLGAGQLLLCSSAADERSWESNRYPNGVFTHFLIQGLTSRGPSTKIGDAFGVLQKGVADEVQQDQNVSQTPRLKTDLWRGNDLILQTLPAHPEPLPETVKKLLEPDSKGKPI